jgi:hypothetical protein
VWDSADQQLARAVQKTGGRSKKTQRGEPIDGLATKLDTLNESQFNFRGEQAAMTLQILCRNVPCGVSLSI